MSSLFFFSSRRRHTRFKCDWSSDVCSSDLADSLIIRAGWARPDFHGTWSHSLLFSSAVGALAVALRSEERRVGKECRYGWLGDDVKIRLETSSKKDVL